MFTKSLIVLFIATFYVADAQLTWTGGTTLTLAEDETLSTAVGTYTVSDGTGAVAYTLVVGTPPFQIDSSSGELSLSTALDYETANSHTVEIQAVDSADPKVTGTTTITVTVTDVNEAAPSFASNSYSQCIPDGTGAGSPVTTVSATDADTANTISYTITGGNTGTVFEIPTANTGLIQVQTGNTLSATATFTVEVTATDNGSPEKSGTVSVTVSVVAACNSAITATVSMLLLLVVFLGTLF